LSEVRFQYRARQAGIADQDLEDVRRGALLHDIGKIAVPDHILRKPGPLTDAEWVIMRTHPKAAYDILKPIKHLANSLDIPYCHHERWDGAGYPRGLKGDAIPLSARIFAVIDVWDALLSDRPYRKAWEREKVIEYIRENSGTHFDPVLADLFLKMMSQPN
jgi:HD-GYP domain-containing protein (c-di-GMP phosphodiesterase class II)